MADPRAPEAILGSLRVPLNGLAGLVELMASSQLTREQRQYLHVFKSTITQLAVQVEDGIACSVTVPQTRATTFEPRQVLDGIRDAFLATAHVRALEMHLACAADVPEEVIADPVAWRHLIFAAVERAIAGARTGVQGRATYDGVSLQFVASSDAAFAHGEGDGSPLVADPPAITAHFGGTWSTEKRGDTWCYTFRLPAIAAPARRPNTTNVVEFRRSMARHRIAIAPANILLVEDQGSTRSLIRKILERAGHTVTDYERAEDALDALEHATFDVILVDLHLPGMSGVAMMREYRAMQVGRRTPAIGISADDSEQALRDCQSAGLLGLVPKPPRPERLLAVLSFALSPPGRSVTDANQALGEEPIIDRASLREVESIGGKALVDKTIRQSLEDFGRCLADIRTAAMRQDDEAWRDAVHALRGVALNVGALRLAAAAAQALDDRSPVLGGRDFGERFHKLIAEAEDELASAV